MDTKLFCFISSVICLLSVHAHAQIPLGIINYEPELLPRPEFQLFGQKYGSQSLAEDEQFKFRRHTEVDFLETLKKVSLAIEKRSRYRPRSRKRIPQKRVSRAFGRRNKFPKISLKSERKIDSSVNEKENNLKANQLSKETNHIQTSKITHRKPFETLVVERDERVLNTTRRETQRENTNGNSTGIEEYMLIRPKGSSDAGSLAFVRINHNAQNDAHGASVYFSVMKSPFNDSYYRQLHNDPEMVAAILGKSAKNALIPPAKSVLSKVMQNYEREINNPK